MTTYLTIYTAAMLTAVLATPAIARLARAWGAVDAPGIRKIHRKAIPRIGGTAIVLAMLVGMIPACVLDGGPESVRRRRLEQCLALGREISSLRLSIHEMTRFSEKVEVNSHIKELEAELVGAKAEL